MLLQTSACSTCLGKFEKLETLCESEVRKSHLQDGSTMLLCKATITPNISLQSNFYMLLFNTHNFFGSNNAFFVKVIFSCNSKWWPKFTNFSC